MRGLRLIGINNMCLTFVPYAARVAGISGFWLQQDSKLRCET